MDAKQLTKQYLEQVSIMQLATAEGNSPWVITVHFCTDDNMNFYWASKKFRQHSLQLEANKNVAATVMVHENNMEEDYVVGITIQGQAFRMDAPVSDVIKQKYITKLGKDPVLFEEIADPDGQEAFYVLKPSKIVLFDTNNFPSSPRKEINYEI